MSENTIEFDDPFELETDSVPIVDPAAAEEKAANPEVEPDDAGELGPDDETEVA